MQFFCSRFKPYLLHTFKIHIGHTNLKNYPNFFWTTLLLNEGIPRALKGKKLCLKIPRGLPSTFELFFIFQIWGQNTIGGQYMQNIDALIFWYKYLQKVNAMPSDFWWKKNKFCSIDEYFFNPFFSSRKQELLKYFFSCHLFFQLW